MTQSIIDFFKNKTINQNTVPRLISIFIIFLLFNLGLALVVYFSYTNPLEPDYYSTIVNGQSEKLSTLDEPNTSDSVVRQWANIAVVDTFTFDFVNYQASLDSDAQYFTSEGWYTFLRSLNDSNNLSTVISKKLVVTAVALKPPSILTKGILNGVYSWRIQIPILVTYQSASEFIQQKLLVTLLVSRISTFNNPKGLGIDQFLVSNFIDDSASSSNP